MVEAVARIGMDEAAAAAGEGVLFEDGYGETGFGQTGGGGDAAYAGTCCWSLVEFVAMVG